MSDPTWASRTLPDGAAATIYVQAAGAGTDPTASDMLAFVTDASIDITGQKTKKGPWLNYKKQKTVSSGVGYAGSATIDWSEAEDDVRAMLITAAVNQTRLKITVEVYESGDTFVMDQALPDASIAISAADGSTGEFAWESDTCVYTPASDE